MTGVVDRGQALLDSVRQIATETAAGRGHEVDRAGRFPFESIAALREARALSALVPRELGGEEVGVDVVAECCRVLGRACGASAMVFAMHHIQLASIARHCGSGSWHAGYLARVADEQRLIASVTSEIGTGGDMGRSVAAVEPGRDGSCRFTKQAPTVSYGIHADDLLTTLRRHPDAAANDQVAALTFRDQTSLEITGSWDVLGMRGTCSPGGTVSATFAPEQILEAPFAEIATDSMVPISHVLWSHVWLGIAEDAFGRAQVFVRAAARRSPSVQPPAAHRLSRVMSELSLLRAEVDCGLRDFLAGSAPPDRERLRTASAVLRFNNLKIATSEHAAEICRGALGVCGIAGFKNDTPFSVGRQLRDTMSAALMVANDRIHDTNAGLLLVAKEV